MKVAILYQIKEPPAIDGICKPMKPGGYRDSGADIAVTLRAAGIPVAVPVSSPNEENDLDWVFPDDSNGIQRALEQGADTFWLNTVLYKGHPIEKYIPQGYFIIGQEPADVSIYDDKFLTNCLLAGHGLTAIHDYPACVEPPDDLPFPLVLKPIRGRGSQGVFVVHNREEYDTRRQQLLAEKIYGDKLMVEPFLSGSEITVSVLPPNANNGHPNHWCLPVVERFHHMDGIAPYNGTVAVVENSRAVPSTVQLEAVCKQCVQAAELLHAKALIRIDCRADKDGNYFLFDLNVKPNLTGAARRHRSNQDCLTMIAARAAGWTYQELLLYLLGTRWSR